MLFVGFIARNLVRRPVRSALTVLGLAVAVGSMVALLGISHNVERAVADGFERRGVDLVAIAHGADQLTSELDEDLVARVRQVPGVEEVEAALVELVEVPRGGSNTSVLAHGWPPENFSHDDLKVLAGRRLGPGDAGKVMLGSTLAQNLGKGVGDTVPLQGEPFEVAGVFQSLSVFENGSITVLLSELQRLSARQGKVTGFSIRAAKGSADPAGDVEAVRQRLAGLTDEAGKPVKMNVQPTRNYVQTASHLKITRAMAWMVSSIAILIGVISMLNTMVMSVLERTQEIGILRAVGWPRSRVVAMVLGEAVLLGVAAAAAGTAMAAGVTYLLTLSPKVNGFIECGIAPAVVAQGLGITVLIGLAGGAYPAIRAARLLPTEAIRHD